MNKKFISFCFFALCSFAIHAQNTNTPAQSALEMSTSPDAKRALINTERTRLESAFAVEDTECYKRFLVNKCLIEVNSRRREALASLKRQENYLNAVDRKIKGEEQIQKTEEKASLENQQEQAIRRADALKDHEARLEREKQKNADHLTTQSNEKSNSQAAANRIKSSQEKAEVRTAKQAGASEEAKKFKERQDKAKERQARRDRDLLNLGKPAEKSLPLPE